MTFVANISRFSVPGFQPADNGGLPALLVDWAQVLGTAFSLVALVAAFFAIWKSGRDIENDREQQYELEILQSIADLIASKAISPQDADRNLRTYLLLLPGSDDFPIYRAALSARPTPEQVAAFERSCLERAEPWAKAQYAEALRRRDEGRQRFAKQVDDSDYQLCVEQAELMRRDRSNEPTIPRLKSILDYHYEDVEGMKLDDILNLAGWLSPSELEHLEHNEATKRTWIEPTAISKQAKSWGFIWEHVLPAFPLESELNDAIERRMGK